MTVVMALIAGALALGTQARAQVPQLDIQLSEAVQHAQGKKRIVLETWQDFQKGDVDAGLANMTEDVTWLAPGANKLAGLKDGKAALRSFRKGELKLFADLHHKVRGLYEDGDTVVMELSSWGHLINGQAYDNAGVTVWDFENGKIKHVRQYVDTVKAMALNALLKDQPPAAR
jgi:ketosteroid isomerase-like protein